MTTRKLYTQELKQLAESLEEMGNLVEASLSNLLFAIENKDDALAQQIIRDDRKVNDLERSIEAQCLALITRQQPIAGDLRIVSSALKAVTDIERIGDHASDIAEHVLHLNNTQPEAYAAHIQPMIGAAREMVHDAVSAFLSRDRKKATEVIAADDVVDSLFEKVKGDIVQKLKTENGQENACLDVLMIAKYLERIGDHAVNICEWEIFQETGSIQDMQIL